MQKYQKHFSTKQTPQSEPIPTAKTPQTKMRSGGFGWKVDDWKQLHRFLILGSEGGTFYVREKKLTKENANAVLRCIKADGRRVVKEIVEVSHSGRAHKNDPVLFALAMCAKLGDEGTREAAYRELPKVARIGTHLFHFMEYIKAFGGLGGSGLKRAIQRWYTQRPAEKLSLQAVKYQQRDGWSHRDALRLAHPVAKTAEQQAIFHWMVKGRERDLDDVLSVPKDVRVIWAFERAKELEATAEGARELIKLITDYRLPHEAVPNDFKKRPDVWEAILQSMPPGAMLRNVNRLTAVGLLTGTSDATRKVISTFGDLEALKRARVHPMAVLMAMAVYRNGHGLKGALTWRPVAQVLDALDKAFYLSFGTVEPMGKRICLALDVSGSMCSPIGGTFVSAREASSAMALVTLAVEPMTEIIGFTSGSQFGWRDSAVEPLAISTRQRLDDVTNYTRFLPFGGTDCALPMLWALGRKQAFDAFVIYTDNESWAGRVHPDQALNQYRQKMGIPAKLVACAMTADRYSVANPDDTGQLDVVGFDAATPNVISNFISEALGD